MQRSCHRRRVPLGNARSIRYWSVLGVYETRDIHERDMRVMGLRVSRGRRRVRSEWKGKDPNRTEIRRGSHPNLGFICNLALVGGVYGMRDTCYPSFVNNHLQCHPIDFVFILIKVNLRRRSYSSPEVQEADLARCILPADITSKSPSNDQRWMLALSQYLVRELERWTICVR